MECQRLMAIIRGETPADLVLRNGKIVNVFSGEIYQADIAVADGKIVSVGCAIEAEETVDLAGQVLCPGFHDAHVHIESSMVTIPEFARTVVPRGTTTVVIDPHEIANVMGLDGIKYMLQSSKYQPLNVYVMLSSCVPATHLETSGSELRALDLFPYAEQEWILGLGEMMNFPGVLACDPETIDKLKLFAGKKIDGHAPGLTGAELCGYVAMGIESDHECTSVEEAREKLRLGMTIMIREGGTAKNLEALLPLVGPETLSRCCLCTDDRNPPNLLGEGHIDFVIRKAISLGLDPISAVTMATINPARYFGLKKTGAIAPGYDADLVVVEDLKSFKVSRVYKNGSLVGEDGEAVYELPRQGRRQLIRSSVNIQWLSPASFQIPARGPRCRVIEMIPEQIVTGEVILEPRIEDGLVVADPARDLLKIAVVERHHASENLGLGLVTGFGLARGALASSVAHDSHNIIVIGANDEDMLEAVIKIRKMGGGFTAVSDGELLAQVPLPIAGLMSDRPMEELKDEVDHITEIARGMGVSNPEPFMALSFMALPVIPKLKITDRGLVDVDRFDFVDLFVEEKE